MTPLRFLYKIVRYWRCFSLLLIASFLSMFLIYASQHDPNMEYFGLGVNYFKQLIDLKPEDMKKLVETNKIDYEFSRTNARFCFNTNPAVASASKLQLQQQQQSTSLNANIDLMFGGEYDQVEFDSLKSSRVKYADILLLSISQAANFRHRSAARQTWAKNLNDMNARLLFIIGNPFYDAENRTNGNSEPLAQFDSNDQNKLEKEMNMYNDIMQINMPDQESYKSTKTLIAIRWSFTYCSHVNNLFILSDTAVLNMDKFSKVFVRNKNDLQKALSNETIVGNCNLKDEKFSSALKVFFKHPNLKPQGATLGNKSTNTVNNDYNGEYCSNLGWIISLNAAKHLWTTALKSKFAIRVYPSYLNGFLAFKSNLKRSTQFKTYETLPGEVGCLKMFSNDPDYLLCNEDFTIKSRYSSFIATWNWPSQGQLFHKL